MIEEEEKEEDLFLSPNSFRYKRIRDRKKRGDSPQRVYNPELHSLP